MTVYAVFTYDSMASSMGRYEREKTFRSKARADEYCAAQNAVLNRDWRRRCRRDEDYPWPSYVEAVKVE